MVDFPAATVMLEAAEPPLDHRRLREQFERDGVVLVRGVLPTELIARARDDLGARLERQGVLTMRDGRPRWTGATIEHVDADALHHDDPAFVDVAESAALASALEVVVGEAVHVYRSVNIRTSLPHDDRHIIPAHQDAMYIGPDRRFAAYWIPLTDIAVGAGGLALVPGSQRDGLLPHPVSHDHWSFYMGEERPQRCVPYASIDEPWAGAPMRAGDLLVFDSHLVHTALPNRSEDVRLSIDGRFQLASRPLVNWQARLTVLEGTQRRRRVLELMGADAADLTADHREQVIALMLAEERPLDERTVASTIDEVSAGR
jgi:ectoine hydroxylase-related dioxygenase (phytanoyl-CoA dioxygenase family)